MSDPAPASVPLWARCSKCRHCWPAAYYPLELTLVAKIAKGHARCPKCNTPGVVARQNNGVLLDPPEAADD